MPWSSPLQATGPPESPWGGSGGTRFIKREEGTQSHTQSELYKTPFLSALWFHISPQCEEMPRTLASLVSPRDHRPGTSSTSPTAPGNQIPFPGGLCVWAGVSEW